jgi:hypothetical protein
MYDSTGKGNLAYINLLALLLWHNGKLWCSNVLHSSCDKRSALMITDVQFLLLVALVMQPVVLQSSDVHIAVYGCLMFVPLSRN